MIQQETARYFIGIDLGGTNTKFGIISETGERRFSTSVPTPAQAGRETLLDLLKTIAQICLAKGVEIGVALSGLGVATPGWVNPQTGRVVYAGGNIAGWTGTDIAGELRAVIDLPIAVENDANALAVAEKYFGQAGEAKNFVCVTLGTGIGSGCYIGGRLHYGANYLANELGHVQIQSEGLPCTCGKQGCLEAYANASSLIRYAGERCFTSAQEVIAAAHSGHSSARNAVRTYARFLAMGCVSAIHLLDPSLLIFSGGITQNNPALLSDLKDELSSRLLAPEWRDLQIVFSELGYFGGMLGGAAVAIDRLTR